MIPARWEGAGAGLSWITMTRRRKENTHTRTLVQCSTETIAHLLHTQIIKIPQKQTKKPHHTHTHHSLISSQHNLSGLNLN